MPPPHPLELAIMSAMQPPAFSRNKADTMATSRARLARRLQLESCILWPVFGMLSATYVGLLGRVLGIW
jgi:hypothetical protein